MEEIIWVAHDPLGKQVILKQSTYDFHISDKPKRGKTNAENLQAVTENVKGVIENPRFIYHDKDYSKNSRYRYLDFVYMAEISAIRALVVVVDTDREPNEVATWTIKRGLNQENPTKDAIIYDARAY